MMQIISELINFKNIENIKILMIKWRTKRWGNYGIGFAFEFLSKAQINVRVLKKELLKQLSFIMNDFISIGIQLINSAV